MTIKRLSVTIQVYEEIKNKILKGEYGLGAPINIVHLSEELGTSNTPIREALSKLETEGLITSSINSKYKVIELSEEELSDLNNAVLIQVLGGLNLCIRHHKIENLILLLQKALDVQQSLYHYDDDYSYITASIDFDRAFIAASENAMLLKTFDSLSAPLALSTIYNQITYRQQNINEHFEILSALKSGDFDQTKKRLGSHYDKHFVNLAKIKNPL